MRAKPEFRDREETQVAVLDALVERGREGMTIFELRSVADIDIDGLESALAELKDDGLIDVENRHGNRTLIKPAQEVIPDPDEENGSGSVIQWLRDKIPF